MIWPEKLLFLRGGLGSSSIIWDRHKVQTWKVHQSGKRAKTRNGKVLWDNSNVCRNYREKTGRGGLFAPSPPFWRWIKVKDIALLWVKAKVIQNQMLTLIQRLQIQTSSSPYTCILLSKLVDNSFFLCS